MRHNYSSLVLIKIIIANIVAKNVNVKDSPAASLFTGTQPVIAENGTARKCKNAIKTIVQATNLAFFIIYS